MRILQLFFYLISGLLLDISPSHVNQMSLLTPSEYTLGLPMVFLRMTSSAFKVRARTSPRGLHRQSAVSSGSGSVPIRSLFKGLKVKAEPKK